MVTGAVADLVGSAAATALTLTTAGLGTDAGARYRPDELIVPTTELPPLTPFTFQITALFALFCTVAVNWCVRLTRTLADEGDSVTLTGCGGATIATKTAVDTSPSEVLTTIGTDGFGAGALPIAVSFNDETNVVASATPSNETLEPAVNPAPLIVSVKLPAGTGEGATDVTLGSGRMVIEALPVDAGDAVLAAPRVTDAGLGTTDGA